MSKPPIPTSGSQPQTRPSRQNSAVAPLFSLGQVVATPGALQVLEQHAASAFELLRRHQRGDWCDPGELCADDRASNDQALLNGARLFSVYRVNGVRLYVITEAVDDNGARPCTTALLPTEY